MGDKSVGITTSVWMATTKVPLLSVLTKDLRADVCIVGAGIAGMTTAYMLSRQDMSVVVLDSGSIGGGQTERTTAHLANEIDDLYIEIERLHSKESARLAAESHTAAIDTIETIATEERIECGFERLDGYLFVPPGEPTEVLHREPEAASLAVIRGVEFVERAPFTSFDTGPCLRFPRQGQFHPLKYLMGLCRAIKRFGEGILHERSTVCTHLGC